MLTRRRLLTLAASGLAVAGGSTLTGCGGPLPEPEVTRPGFGEDARGTLTFWCRAATLPASQLVVDRFHAAQDAVRVELSAIPEAQFVTKLATAIRGRSVPDLVGIDDINSLLFSFRDAFTDLTPLVDGLPFRGSLSPGHLRLATLDDRTYGLPYVGDLSRLFYNKVLFERAGLDPDAPPTTFEQIVAAARAVQDLGDGVSGYSFAGNCPGCLGFTMLPNIWATDTDLFAGAPGEQRAAIDDNAALPRVLELYRELWDSGVCPPANRTETGATWGQDFVRGEVGLLPGSYGFIVLNSQEEQRRDFGVTTLCGPDGGSSLFCGGDILAIPRGAGNASAAWAFVQFVLDQAQQRELPTAGYTPIRSDVLDDDFRSRFPLDVIALENLDRAYAPQTLVYNSAFNQVDGPFFQMFQRAVYRGDVDGAIEAAQVDLTRLLEQAQV